VIGARRAWCVLATVGLAAGCGSAVYFPSQSMPAAKWPGAAAIYDTNRDGRADFFTFADPAGRVNRIAYDRSRDEKPDLLIDLDDIPFDRCRHLVIILDGFGYDVVKSYYAAGGLRLFHPPSRVVTPYPSLTNLCVSDALGHFASRGFRSKYYDHKRNLLRGGFWDYLRSENDPYVRLLGYRANKLWDGIAYLRSRPVFDMEIDDLKSVFDRRARRETLAYLSSSAGVSTQFGEAGQRKCLERVEQLVNQVIWETRGLAKVTLLADHGHGYEPPKYTDLAEQLQQQGWHRTSRLRQPTDFCPIHLGVATVVSFATREPAQLALDAITCEGVELASYADLDRVVVLSKDGGKAAVRKKNGRYRYERISGDPLGLSAILAGLERDGDGYVHPDVLLKATATHQYPAPLQRLWRTHFGLAENPSDVVVSLGNGFCFGPRTFARVLTIASTHGSLNYQNSVTFVMSTVGPLPPLMRSRDIPGHLGKLIDAPWPLGK